MKGISRRATLIAVGGFGVGLIGTTAIGASWLRDDRRPSLTVLGCGRGLSVLLTSGGSRMLQLGGTQYTDFGNALSSARYPRLDRIDLLLVPGHNPTIPLVETALRQVEARNIYSIGSARDLFDAGLSVDRELLAPHHFALPGGTNVTVSVLRDSSSSDSSQVSWSMVIRWRTHHVLVDSGGDIKALPPESRRASAWIRASGSFSADEIQAMEPAAILITAESMSGSAMREILKADVRNPVYGYRIHGGDTARLVLGSDGIHLPGNPASTPSREAFE